MSTLAKKKKKKSRKPGAGAETCSQSDFGEAQGGKEKRGGVSAMTDGERGMERQKDERGVERGVHLSAESDGGQADRLEEDTIKVWSKDGL